VHDVGGLLTGGISKRTSVLAVAVGVLVVLAVGAGSGAADPGGHLFRDHGRGAWFERVCDVTAGARAGCEAQVVTDASGDPLAGSSPPGSALGPQQLHGAYDLPDTAAGGTAPVVAIVDAYDDPNIEADLGAFDTQYGLPGCTTANGCFTKVNQSGGTSYPAANASWDLEISLDVETVHAICQDCKILLVEASSASISDLGTAENEAASLGAVAISNSWGAAESALGSSETVFDSSFDHPGVAITASTGDGGYGVEWPAVSPYVTAVGGTTLTVGAGNTYGGESAWVDGGSGCSTVETRPSWQAGLGGCTMRSVADVAADADPNTGAAVFDSVPYQGASGWFQVGGTSLASPIIASVYALADNTSTIANGSTPYAYRGTTALHDVTTGNNGSCGGSYLCTAGPGYDGPTGVGTPDGVAAFSPGGGPPPPPPDFSLSVPGQSGSPVAGSGGSATYTVAVNPLNSFTGQVTLGASGEPAGVTPSFSPPSAAPGSPATMTLSVSSSVSAGTYPITVTGVSGALSHTVNATLTVTAGGPSPDFSIGVSPSSQTISGSGVTSYTVTVSPLNGFTGTVSLSVGGLPGRVSASFSPSGISSGSGVSTLAIRASRARAGTRILTIRGQSGTLSHTATATLAVT
jgi:hypothetical protein